MSREYAIVKKGTNVLLSDSNDQYLIFEDVSKAVERMKAFKSRDNMTVIPIEMKLTIV